jgi:hypothetical protein
MTHKVQFKSAGDAMLFAMHTTGETDILLNGLKDFFTQETGLTQEE